MHRLSCRDPVRRGVYLGEPPAVLPRPPEDRVEGHLG